MAEGHGAIPGPEIARQDPHLLIPPARRPDIGERARADQEVVAVRQILHAQEARMRIVREQPDGPRRQVDLERVAEALRHERDPPPVRRPGRAFPEPRQVRDVGRQMVFRVARLRVRTGPTRRAVGTAAARTAARTTRNASVRPERRRMLSAPSPARCRPPSAVPSATGSRALRPSAGTSPRSARRCS